MISIEDAVLRSAWDATPELRAEFREFKVFAAFERNKPPGMASALPPGALAAAPGAALRLDAPELRRIVAGVMRQPWAIQPEWLETIHTIATRSHDVGAVRARMGGRLQNSRNVEVRDGVAIIPVVGPIMPRANMLTEVSGATSVQQLALDFQAALDADQAAVHAILLDVDSPGGVAFGVGELAAEIHAARARKPVTAYVGGVGASAAYWLASAASEVVAHETAILGSIGVVMAVPVQEAADRDGYRTIEVVSSNAENKRPDPRTEAGRASIQATLDGLEAEFVAAVARQRGVTPAKVNADFGRGGGDAAPRGGGRDAGCPVRGGPARRMAGRPGAARRVRALRRLRGLQECRGGRAGPPVRRGRAMSDDALPVEPAATVTEGQES